MVQDALSRMPPPSLSWDAFRSDVPPASPFLPPLFPSYAMPCLGAPRLPRARGNVTISEHQGSDTSGDVTSSQHQGSQERRVP